MHQIPVGPQPTFSSPRSLILLLVVGASTLVLTTFVNSGAAHLLELLKPGSSWVGYTAGPSALVALLLYLAVQPERPLAMPGRSTPWAKVLRLSGLWLAAWLVGSFAYAVSQGQWSAYVSGTPLLIGFLVLGPLGEELLFRGAVFELAQRSFPASALTSILLSTVLFSAHHLELHGFRITPFVLTQLAFTLPMGLVLARVRSLTGSIWPSLLLHILTNLPHAFGMPPTNMV